MKIKLLKNITVNKEFKKIGSICEVDKNIGIELIAIGDAIIYKNEKKLKKHK